MEKKWQKELQRELLEFLDFKPNRFHPLVWVRGKPEIGSDVYIGFFSIVNAKNCRIKIGSHSFIAPFVSLNCGDSHKRALGLMKTTERKPITLEHNVFVGTHSVIKPGAYLEHHAVVAAGTVVDPVRIPAYSLVSGNPMRVKVGYYKERVQKKLGRRGSRVRRTVSRSAI